MNISALCVSVDFNAVPIQYDNLPFNFQNRPNTEKHDKPLSVMYWIFTIIFAAGFAAIWLTVYITVRIKVDKMNKMLTR